MMFNQLPTESVRHILQYMTIKETGNLYQACGYTHKFFHQRIRSLCLHQFPNKMWLRLPCKKFNYDNNSLNPYQYVPVKIQLREDRFYCAGVCPCCNKRTCFQFDNIYIIKKWSEPNQKPLPYYVSENVIMVGYYHYLPQHMQHVGHVVDALDHRWNRWRQAVITKIIEDHIQVRYIHSGHYKMFKKTSPCLATHGRHTNPWNERNRGFYINLSNTQWSSEGHAVHLLYKNREYSQNLLLMEDE